MTYEIAGARATVEDPEAILKTVRSWTEGTGREVLLADARLVFGRDHVESAVRHALRAQAAGTMAARTVAMEALRYLSGQRQVAEAIRVAGIRRGTSAVAVVVFGETGMTDLLALLGWSRDDSVLNSEGKSLQAIGITQVESETVPPDRRADLALEKVALLDAEK